eukprot:547056-Pleurochrysis_carterae.AAC.1
MASPARPFSHILLAASLSSELFRSARASPFLSLLRRAVHKEFAESSPLTREGVLCRLASNCIHEDNAACVPPCQGGRWRAAPTRSTLASCGRRRSSA